MLLDEQVVLCSYDYCTEKASRMFQVGDQDCVLMCPDHLPYEAVPRELVCDYCCVRSSALYYNKDNELVCLTCFSEQKKEV